MGKILTTTYHDTVEKVTGLYSDLVNNPFYIFNDKKPTIATYYNINKDFSSLDPGSNLQYDNLGEESPIRYNKIEGMILYGFNRIELNTDNGDFGLEADKIEGECFILPNTIIPTEGDYFEINHIEDSTWLFMVKDVQKDTLDNGSNAYKISYKLEYDDNTDIKSRIVHNFKMLEDREGTNIAKVVRCEDYDIAKMMDDVAVQLKSYFVDLFYNEKVQSFTYVDSMTYLTYDPYMIEFMIRNQILNNGEDNYVYVTHQINPPKTFAIDYDNSFYRSFEKNDKIRLSKSDYSTYLEKITSWGTTFSARYEDYFKTIYGDRIKPGFNTTCIDEDIIYHIMDNELYTDKDKYKNIFVKYFNNMTDLTSDELIEIAELRMNNSKDMFYLLPLFIFILEKYIEKVLK